MSDDDFDFSLLDKNLSEIEDLPSFETPPMGTYILLVSASTKKVNEHPAVSIDCDVVSTVQLANPNDPAQKPVKDGSKFNLLFMLDSEYGVDGLKKFLLPFVEKFGTDNMRLLVTEHVQNIVISAQVTHRKDKNKTKDDGTPVVYAGLKQVVIQS